VPTDLDQRTLDKILATLRPALQNLPLGGLSSLGRSDFWSKNGFTESEAAQAVGMFSTLQSQCMGRAHDINAGPLKDSEMAMWINLTLDALAIYETVGRNPDLGVRVLVRDLLPLVEAEEKFWAQRQQAPTDFFLMPLFLPTLSALPPSADDIKTHFIELLTVLQPAVTRFVTDGVLAERGSVFTVALLSSEFFVDERIVKYPSAASVHWIHFDRYERDRNRPVRLAHIGGESVEVRPAEPLPNTELRKGVMRRVPGKKPIVFSVEESADEKEARTYASARDGRAIENPEHIFPGWTVLNFRRLMQAAFRGLDLKSIQRTFRRSFITHELFHYWTAVKDVVPADPRSHYGLSPEEWDAYMRNSLSDSNEAPERIPFELGAFLGQFAFAERPFFDLGAFTAILGGERVESVAMNFIFKGVAAKLAASLNGNERDVSALLATQKEALTPEAAQNWLSALAASQDLTRLENQIRQAARMIYEETFVASDGSVARLPQDLDTGDASSLAGGGSRISDFEKSRRALLIPPFAGLLKKVETHPVVDSAGLSAAA
jgi:hypothetical protein